MDLAACFDRVGRRSCKAQLSAVSAEEEEEEERGGVICKYASWLKHVPLIDEQASEERCAAG